MHKEVSVFNEQERVKVLQQYEVLDTAPQKEYNELTRLAAEICNASVARINLIDKKRQWSKAIFGADEKDIEIPRNTSVCQFTILGEKVLEINDLKEDPRFAEMSYVKGDPYLRYYLGAPLLTPEGYALGALCVLDYEPRKMGDRQIRQLQILADEVMVRFELQKKNRELEKLNQHKVNLMKMLSHDMRSPINGIIGMSSLLAGEVTDAGQLEMVEIMEQSANQLNQMIDEIMSYSLIESQGFEISRDEADLSKIIESMEKLYQPVAKVKQIKLKFENLVNEPVQIDGSKFEQIFGNLLSNALKFTNNGGEVSAHLQVDGNGPTQQLILSVQDTGIGMDQSKASNLFSNGPVKNREGTSGEKSTGLGLAIIKYFVDLHSGTINVSSEEGNGTRFIVTLPLVNN